MSYQSEVQADNPVAYWRLGESSGTTASDISGNGLNGTYSGTYTLAQTGLVDDANTAVALNMGTVNAGNPSALQIVGNITVEAVVKLNSLPVHGGRNVHVFVGKGFDGSAEGWVLRAFQPSSGSMQLQFVSFTAPNTQHEVITPIAWSTGGVHHIAGRCSGGLRSLWVDGIKVAEASTTGALATAESVRIGSSSSSGTEVQHCDAIVDEVAIYNTALADARIEAHFNELGGTPTTTEILSASVASNGVDVAINYSTSVSNAALKDFIITAAGKPLPILSVTGNGTSTLTFRLAKSWIITGEVVKVSYVGTALTGTTTPARASVTATNSSTITAKQRKHAEREFGMFLHVTTATYGIPSSPTPLQLNAFNPTLLDVDQWLDAAVSAGMKYAVLTTKHDAGFCLWPTATTPYNITQTTWYGVTPIDIVGQFTTKCRERGLGVGLYINFYDPYFKDLRPGADGTYTAFTPYISAQITELLSNYGKIDLLWIDSWDYRPEIGYTNIPYATITSLVGGLQADCLVMNNARGNQSVSQIAVHEGSGAPDSPPAPTNLVPSEFAESSSNDNLWEYAGSSDATLRTPLEAAQRMADLNTGRTAYLLNFPPQPNGKLSDAMVAHLAAIGAIVGQRGGVKLPPLNRVSSGVDRGDGELGTATGTAPRVSVF